MIIHWIINIALGVIAAGIFTLILILLRRAWQRQVQKTRRKVRRNVARIKSRLLAPGHHPVAGVIVSNLLNRSVMHMLEAGEWISLEEYVTLLQESLGSCTKQLFATSLISPDIWLQGRFKTNYRVYLELQKERLHMCRDRGMKIRRVFIIGEDEFPKNPLKHEIVSEQVNAGFDIGFFPKDELAGNPEFVRDFALFEDDVGKWVVDAGSILAPREENWTYVRVVDDKELIDTFYSSLITRLEPAITKFRRQR